MVPRQGDQRLYNQGPRFQSKSIPSLVLNMGKSCWRERHMSQGAGSLGSCQSTCVCSPGQSLLGPPILSLRPKSPCKGESRRWPLETPSSR